MIVEQNSFPFLKKTYSGVIDCVGGEFVNSGLGLLNDNGVYFSIGNSAGNKAMINILPFILRGINIVGYGAPTKATTIINYLDLSNNKLKFIIDKNPLKHKKFIPGTNIQILGPKYINVKKFKYLFNFAWNFINEILSQQKKFIRSGGKILNPIPKFKIFQNKWQF